MTTESNDALLGRLETALRRASFVADEGWDTENEQFHMSVQFRSGDLEVKVFAPRTQPEPFSPEETAMLESKLFDPDPRLRRRAIELLKQSQRGSFDATELDGQPIVLTYFSQAEENGRRDIVLELDDHGSAIALNIPAKALCCLKIHAQAAQSIPAAANVVRMANLKDEAEEAVAAAPGMASRQSVANLRATPPIRFSNLAACGYSPEQLALLRDPLRRGFLQACRSQIQEGTPLNDETARKIISGLQRSGGPLLARVSELHLAVLEIIQSGAADTQATRVSLAQMAKRFNFPFSQVEALYHEMADAEAALPPAAASINTPLLVVAQRTGPEDECGYALQLTVEAMPDGTGAAFPVPALLFVKFDARWLRAIETARQRISQEFPWAESYDFRYRLTLPEHMPWPLEFRGDSLHGAFELALLRLLCELRPKEINRSYRLRGLNFSGVAVTAGAVGSNEELTAGRWTPVGSLFPKLVAAARKSLPPIQTVIVAQDQDVDRTLFMHDKRRPVWLFREKSKDRVDIVELDNRHKNNDLATALELLRIAPQTIKRKRQRWAILTGSLLIVALLAAQPVLHRLHKWHSRPMRMADLARTIQNREATGQPNAISLAVDEWGKQYGDSRQSAIQEARTWANAQKRSGKVSRTREIAHLLADKLESLSPPAQPDSNHWMIESLGMVLTKVPAGTFLMGSPLSDPDYEDDERPSRFVTLTHSFWMGKYEVTQAEYEKVIGMNPSSIKGIRFSERLKRDVDFGFEPKRPVENLAWTNATEFCRRLTALDQERLNRFAPGYEYRLPTEAEWEYACRAGQTNRFSFGDDPMALTDYAVLNMRATSRVGLKLPNAWGLYDMHGNVIEFCLDSYEHSLPDQPLTDPIVARPSSLRVVKGGSFEDQIVARFRCAERYPIPIGARGHAYGFRIVLAPKPDSLNQLK